ncbi:MAG: GNAT family N-acetyltransferase [Defluviitaleaceae bacterium]|nr:GNAT family N-acetyltransferase [Defluviitaleaceae bacterium]
MKFRVYKDVKEFYKDTYDVLMEDESQNLIPLGNIIIGNEGKDKHDWRDPVNWFMATVSDENVILLTAVMTPPYNLTLYATNNNINDAALEFFINEIIKANIFVPGAMSEKSLADNFANKYSSAKNIEYSISMSQRIYELSQVNPEIPKIGTLRLAKDSDIAFLPYWLEIFRQNEPNAPPTGLNYEDARYHITSNRLYILEDEGIPVSMARIARDMVTICGIGPVFTPPYFRGRGYASSCVAGISSIILERGYKKCVLYTDLANPTSNSIYQKIGYEPVCDSLAIKFE